MRGIEQTEDQLLEELERLRARVGELEESEAEARRRTAELEALRQVGLSVTASLELEEVLDAILRSVLGLLDGVENAEVYLLADGKLAFGASLWADGSTGKPYAQPRPEGLTYTVARRGHTIIVPDIRAHELFADAPAEWHGAIIGLPLKIADRVVGVMNVGYPQTRKFTEAERRVLRLLGDRAAVAIEHAQLYEALRRQAVVLEQRVAERTEELDAYTHTIAHDLKGPLHLLNGYVALVEMDEDLTADGREYLAEISAASKKMAGMIDQLLWLAQVRDVAGEAVPVEVAPLVEAALARFKDRIQARDIDVQVMPDLPSVLGHAPWVEEVFANLIGNAIKYIGDDNPAPRIAVQGIRQAGVVRYEVQDNGIGIAPQDQPRLFEMYTRVNPSYAQGLGLGLSIVHRIISRLNGEVGVESVPDQGSTFWFTLPAPPS